MEQRSNQSPEGVSPIALLSCDESRSLMKGLYVCLVSVTVAGDESRVSRRTMMKLKTFITICSLR